VLFWFFFAVAFILIAFASPMVHDIIMSVVGSYSDPYTRIILLGALPLFVLVFIYYALYGGE